MCMKDESTPESTEYAEINFKMIHGNDVLIK